MIENIAAGLIANFLTSFIKSRLGLSHQPLQEPAVNHSKEQIEHHPGDGIAERRAQNHERFDAVNAALVMVFWFLALLLVATLLPMLMKSLTGEIDLATTRLAIKRSIETFKLGFFVWLLGLPVFWIVQKFTQWLIQLQHNNWSDVGRWQTVRLFTISCFVVLPFYSAIVLFLLFPSLGIVQSIAYPLSLVAIMLLFASARRRR